MFWKYNSSPSLIEAVLAKENVTLEELMDEEDIINECKVQNKLLMEFLTKPDIIAELVTLTTTEPSADTDERMRFKYCNIACEILTCDVPAINERLASDENLLSKLYIFLDSEPPLNSLLASFVSKIMGVLIAKKTEQVLDFLKTKENFISLLLKHLGTSAIMDLTLKLMTQVEGAEVRQNILNWLDSQGIMQSLVSMLDPSIDKERHSNVAQLLCDFIKISRETIKNSTERNDPDPLLNALESPETVSLLLDHMLGEIKCESCIVGGIQVLLALLDINKVCCEEIVDTERKQATVNNIILTILKRLQDFHNLLVDPPKKTPIDTATGALDPPLGNTRLQVIRLFATVISTENIELLQELMALGTVQVLLNLFFQFPWNNFLHTQVQACITSVLKAHIPSETGEDNALYKHLIVNCKLVERILEAWKDNDIQQSEKKGVRQGYMGHLTNIAINVEELCSSNNLGQFLKDNVPELADEFDNFCKTTLQEIKKTRDMLLAGVHPNIANEDNDDYGEGSYSQSAILHQQMFNQYQAHQLAPQVYIENYGFNDDDFNDGDDPLQTIDHRTGMNFDLSEGDLVQQHEMFKEVCAQNINTLDDADDQIFEDRDHTLETVIEKQGEHHNTIYSSDSDDDSPPPEDPFMDIDPWANRQSESAVAPISMISPWNANEDNASEASTGWANFSSPSFANFEANFETSEDVASAAEPTKNEIIVETDLKIENIEVDTKNNLEFTKQNSEIVVCTGNVVDETLDGISKENGAKQGLGDNCILSKTEDISTTSSTKLEGNTNIETGSTPKIIPECGQEGI